MRYPLEQNDNQSTNEANKNRRKQQVSLPLYIPYLKKLKNLRYSMSNKINIIHVQKRLETV